MTICKITTEISPMVGKSPGTGGAVVCYLSPEGLIVESGETIEVKSLFASQIRQGSYVMVHEDFDNFNWIIVA